MSSASPTNFSTPTHFADRWLEASRDKGAPICVGLDPVWDKLPRVLHDMFEPSQIPGALEAFCTGVIWAVAEHTPAVKLQMACYERYGPAGIEVFFNIVQEAKNCGLIVIADAKRGDIGASSAHYGEAYFGSDGMAVCDALTVNSYLGVDGIQPMIDAANAAGSGVFVLVRTSNPGGDALQTIPLADGRTVTQAVADLVVQAGETCRGQSGYSSVGAVVGATKPEDAQALRKRMPQQLFLVPGYGAQGGSAEDVRACFNEDGQGAIIAASRSVIYAFDQNDEDWTQAVEQAAITMKQDIRKILAG